MRKLLFLIACLVASVYASAQVAYGPVAGASFATQSRSFGKNDKVISSMAVGYHIGGELLAPLPVVGLEIETDLLLHRKGSHYTENGGPEITTTYYYLDLPIRLNYALGLSRTNIFIGIGPTFSYALSGSREREKNKVEDVLNDFNQRHWDIAIGAQLGVRIVGVQFKVFYDLGLVDISRNPHHKVGNRVLGLQLGYLF